MNGFQNIKNQEQNKVISDKKSASMMLGSANKTEPLIGLKTTISTPVLHLVGNP